MAELERREINLQELILQEVREGNGVINAPSIVLPFVAREAESGTLMTPSTPTGDEGFSAVTLVEVEPQAIPLIDGPAPTTGVHVSTPDEVDLATREEERLFAQEEAEEQRAFRRLKKGKGSKQKDGLRAPSPLESAEEGGPGWVYFTSHGRARGAQRNLSPQDISYVFEHASLYLTAEAAFHVLLEKDVPEPDRSLDEIKRLIGTTILMTKDGKAVKTCYINPEAPREIKKKRKGALMPGITISADVFEDTHGASVTEEGISENTQYSAD